MSIQFIDLQRQYQNIQAEIDAQIRAVLESGRFIMGPQVGELERQLASFVGTKHAVGCASGTDALLLALMAYDVQPGDEIITTPFSFIATSEVIALLKARPVFVDIDPETYNIDPRKIPEAITERTKGIVPVDIFGQCAEYDDINAIAKEHDLFVVEDAAQSFGAEYNGRKACALADIGCTSFFPAKPLGCYGDGGMVFTNDDRLQAVMQSLRVHGKGNNKYDNVRIGLNARLDTIQAAILLAKFQHYPDEITLRNQVAAQYTKKFGEGVRPPQIRPYNLSVFAQYCIQVTERPGLQEYLKKAGIPTAIHYPKPLHLQTAFAELGHHPGDFPVAEDLCQHILALPMHPYLTREEQDLITTTIAGFRP